MLEVRKGMFYVFFFFKQKTAYEIYQCDWSSDVCSSDLPGHEAKLLVLLRTQHNTWQDYQKIFLTPLTITEDRKSVV